MSGEQIKPGYKLTEVGVIPVDWSSSTIGEVCSFSGGSQPPRYTFKFAPSADYIRLIQIRDYKSDSFETYIPVSLAQKRCTASDIMIGRYGPPIFQILRGIDGAYNVALIKAIPSERIDREYLFYVLKQEKLFQLIDALSRRSSGQTGVDLPALKEFGLPLPSLPEQRAIATALSDVDALLAKLDQLIAKKRDLKQATMQQLLTGQTRLPGFSGEWEVKRLGEVASLKNGYTFKSETYSPLGCYKVITIANVQDGYMVLDDCNSVDKTPPDIQPHQLLKIGDILISMTGNVGRICRVSEEFCLLNQRVGKLAPTLVQDDFLFALLRQPSFIVSMSTAAKGGAQPNLSAADIGGYEFFISADAAEQTAIAKVLSDMDAEIATLEARRDKTRTLKQGMLQELLTGRIRLI